MQPNMALNTLSGPGDHHYLPMLPKRSNVGMYGETHRICWRRSPYTSSGLAYWHWLRQHNRRFPPQTSNLPCV